MRTIETKVYKFHELSEQAKEEAIESLYDINVNFEWWDFTYDDAEEVGIKITEFDIDRGSYAKGHFLASAEETAHKIIDGHGEMCETHKTAKEYLQDRDNLVAKYSDDVTKDWVAEDNEYEFDAECDELDAEFLRSILEDYRIILSKEYDYLTSKEAIIGTIEANEYEFTEDGIMF